MKDIAPMTDGIHLKTLEPNETEILPAAIVSYAMTIMGEAIVDAEVYAESATIIAGMLAGLRVLDLPRHCLRTNGIRLVVEHGRLTYAGRGKSFIPFRPIPTGENQP